MSTSVVFDITEHLKWDNIFIIYSIFESKYLPVEFL